MVIKKILINIECGVKLLQLCDVCLNYNEGDENLNNDRCYLICGDNFNFCFCVMLKVIKIINRIFELQSLIVNLL